MHLPAARSMRAFFMPQQEEAELAENTILFTIFKERGQ